MPPLSEFWERSSEVRSGRELREPGTAPLMLFPETVLCVVGGEFGGVSGGGGAGVSFRAEAGRRGPSRCGRAEAGRARRPGGPASGAHRVSRTWW